MGVGSDEEFLDSDMETDDDSQEDPSFDIIQQHTQSKLSKLSITTSRIPPDDCIETEANHQKTYEFVQNMIQAGQVEKLKVEQCKLYLRKHGLRLSGKKDVLIHRINDHISIMNGEGEHKYPASSFVMNCKGDSCTGDIVMFEQNVYEMFNVASKSATGPPCGTRVVAGRIVKESYGAAKQQHTFTIEVLWSKGEKPLPPLHPLLIKGRNLYRLKTMRQRWEDESQRRKILSEKHSRGDAARLNREARLQEKEKKKALRENRASKGNIRIEKDDTMINEENPRKPDLQNISNQHGDAPYKGFLGNCSLKSMTHNNHGGTHKENIIPNDLKSPVRREPHGPFRRSFQVEQNIIHNDFRSPVRGESNGAFRKSFQAEQSTHFYPSRVFERHDYDHRANIYLTRNPGESYNFHQGNNHHQVPRGRYQGQRQQLCRYYSQGRCHFGTNCKYLH